MRIDLPSTVRKPALVAAAASVLMACQGCVQRKLQIRSRPQDAPVWVDEQYAGETPVDLPFTHYGGRRLRVGPIRDEDGTATYQSSEEIVNIKAPWYQKFPLDFFSEVLWPGTVEDIHLHKVHLAPVERVDDEDGEQRIMDEAREFRDRAGHPPEDR